MWFDCALDWMWERMSGWTNTRVFGTLDFMPLLSARQTSSSALSLSVRSLACLPFNQRIVVSYTHLLSAFIINMATSAQHSRALSLSFAPPHPLHTHMHIRLQPLTVHERYVLAGYEKHLWFHMAWNNQFMTGVLCSRTKRMEWWKSAIHVEERFYVIQNVIWQRLISIKTSETHRE